MAVLEEERFEGRGSGGVERKGWGGGAQCEGVMGGEQYNGGEWGEEPRRGVLWDGERIRRGGGGNQ